VVAVCISVHPNLVAASMPHWTETNDSTTKFGISCWYALTS